MPTVVTPADATSELLAEEARHRAEKNGPAAAPKGTPTMAVPIRMDLLFGWPDGQKLVCCRAQVFADGQKKMIEEWRQPTADELKLVESATLVQGGPVEMVPEKKSNAWKWVLGSVAGVATVGGMAVWLGPKVADAIYDLREKVGVDDPCDDGEAEPEDDDDEEEDCDDEE